MSFIPTLPIDRPIESEDERYANLKLSFTPAYWNFLQSLLQYLQKNISREGFVMPSQNNQNMALLEASDSILPGTVIFNTQTVNGGTSDNPKGQLYVKLQDGVFHAIPNL